MITEPVDAILIGAGQRGAEVYGAYALDHPAELRFVAVAEPDLQRRAHFAAQHQIPAERQYPSWEPLLARSPLGRAAVVCTQDQQHTAPTLAALETGYDVLLEKPMATTPAECRQLVSAAEAAGRQLHVCHVLRYTRHFQTMQAIVASGVLGQIVNVDHRENVSFWHMAHSYVRGNWAETATSSPMILAKCCHDFDILLWLLGRSCTHLSSFGRLTHFRPENAPDGAPEYCLDGCPASETCPYYAPFVYVEMLPFWRGVAETGAGLERMAARAQGRQPGLVRLLSIGVPALREASHYSGWPRSVVAREPIPERLVQALRRGPYGRCVYRCDNDVVDNQIVAMAFEGGIQATLTMHGHSHLEGRSTRIEGSRGGLSAFMGMAGGWIEVREHRSGRRTRYETHAPRGKGHGGGDQGLTEAFVRSLQGAAATPLTTARQALEGHLLAFAAEQARQEQRVVSVAAFKRALD